MNNIEADIERSARLAAYGVREENPLWLSGISHDQVVQETYRLADKRVVRIERLRLLSDFGLTWWDISYCYGRLLGGDLVRVDLGVYQINKIGRGVDKRHLVQIAKANGRYAKDVGLLALDGGVGEAISTVC